MKYQHWASFEKHLAEALPGHLSRIYLAVSACPFERKLVFSQVIDALEKLEPHASVERLDAGSVSLEAVLDKLNSRSLFGGPCIVIFEGVEKLKKSGIEMLTSYVEKPSPFSFLLLGSSSSKQLTSLFQKGKKDLTALDLTEEKPWDRKNRLQRLLIMYAQRQGKVLSAEAALYLLDYVSLDLSALEQEMFKLLCFCVDRKQIGKEDVQKMCAPGVELNSWQLAESIIWEHAPVSLDHSLELSWVLPFIGQLRYQLQIGQQLASALERRLSSEEIGRLFPQIRGPILAKRLDFVRKYSSAYFSAATHLLFELELMMKNSACNPALALDLFTAKLNFLKKTYDFKTASSFASSQFIG